MPWICYLFLDISVNLFHLVSAMFKGLLIHTSHHYKYLPLRFFFLNFTKQLKWFFYLFILFLKSFFLHDITYDFKTSVFFFFWLVEYLLTRFLIMVCRFFYASSACIYPEFKQLDTSNVSLKESDAWPAEVSAEFLCIQIC